MKVLLVNGSPHEKGSTYTALSVIAGELEARDVETEIFHIGTQPISGCIACRGCQETGRCALGGVVNEAIEKAKDCDGFFFGAAVHYASANGAMSCFMDRLFYAGKDCFFFKPAASVVAARRAGTTATYDQLNKYYGINRMITIPSQYWNMMIGRNAEEVREDAEGMEIMRTLGRNMAWMLNVLKAGKEQGFEKPV